MNVALTGVSGFIGSYTARQLKERGHSVVGLIRATSRREHVEQWVDRFVTGDQADERVWPALLEDAECVIHNSVDWGPLRAANGLNEHLERNLVASIRLLHESAPRQFVFISSVAVHHDMRPRWGGIVDEDHPTRPASLYGAYKAAVEAHLWAAHFGEGRHTTALRPCAVYGIDPTLDRSHGHSLIEKLKRGEPVAKPGGGKFVHVEDVAVAIATTVGNADASGKVYNLVDCYARWADWAVIAAEILGIDVEIDLSSPPAPKNSFTRDAARTLGVRLDRGHDGIRDHLHELIRVMDGRS